MVIQKTDIAFPAGIKLDSLSIETSENPDDASVLAKIELRAKQHIIDQFRQGFYRSGEHSVTPHAVDATINGKSILQALLTRATGSTGVTFPEDWALSVEVQENWPQVPGVLSLSLNGGQETDAVAILLGTVGIHHEYV